MAEVVLMNSEEPPTRKYPILRVRLRERRKWKYHECTNDVCMLHIKDSDRRVIMTTDARLCRKMALVLAHAEVKKLFDFNLPGPGEPCYHYLKNEMVFRAVQFVDYSDENWTQLYKVFSGTFSGGPPMWFLRDEAYRTQTLFTPEMGNFEDHWEILGYAEETANG